MANGHTCTEVGEDNHRCRGIACDECPLRDMRTTIGDLRNPAPLAPTDNPVKEPSHYMLFDGTESIEVIARSMTVSEFRGFCFGNVLKYRLRAGKKSELATMEQDLKKAAFYQELFDKHKELCYAE